MTLCSACSAAGDMALAALRAAAGASRSGVPALLRQGAPAAGAASVAQSRGVSSHSENTNTFIREVSVT